MLADQPQVSTVSVPLPGTLFSVIRSPALRLRLSVVSLQEPLPALIVQVTVPQVVSEFTQIENVYDPFGTEVPPVLTRRLLSVPAGIGTPIPSGILLTPPPPMAQ
jgi:hypothetical protein